LIQLCKNIYIYMYIYIYIQVYVQNVRSSVFLNAYLIMTERGGRMIFSDTLDPHNQPQTFLFFENGYWIYFFDFISMPSAGGNAGLIRKLHSFPADVLPSDYCSRYNTSSSSTSLDHLIHFYFLVDRPFFQINSFFPANPSFPSQVP